MHRMTDNQIAALVSLLLSIGAGGVCCSYRAGYRRALRTVRSQRAARAERWTTHRTVTVPDDGSPLALCSAYEDAIYAAARHAAYAAWSSTDELEAVAQAGQLHTDVVRLRTRILYAIDASAELGQEPGRADTRADAIQAPRGQSVHPRPSGQ